MIELKPAREFHVRAVAKHLRIGDRLELERLGASPVAIAVGSWRLALFSSVALFDGKPVAVWGVGGSLLSDVGRPWLLTAEDCERGPLAFALVYRREVRRMLGFFPRLESFVDASYEGAVRLLEIVGFTLGPAEPLGPAGAPFRRFWMVR
jgi:hypothetical protein